MIPRTSSTIAALLLATAWPGGAQDQQRYHADDRNRDGVVSRSEWQGDRAAFRQQDTNRDGVLSGNELPGMSDARSSRARVGNLDKDSSGVVEGYEWPYNAEVFRRLDTNEDSVLSRAELRNLSAATLKDLDSNNNSRLDDDEWSGGFADYDKLDANRDGRVSQQEYSQSGGEWQKRQRFDNWDTNRDGVIQSTEWKTAPRLFHRLDTDGDSKVSWNEFMADTERYRPPYNWR